MAARRVPKTLRREVAKLRVTCLALLVAFSCSATAADRQKARVHYEKGLEKFRLGEMEKAAKEFQRAAREDPTWADAHYQLGQVYLSLGEWEEAEASNGRAVKLDPDHPDAAWWEGLLADRRALIKAAEFSQRTEFSRAAPELLAFLDSGGDLHRFHDAFSLLGINVGWMDEVVREMLTKLADTAQWHRLQAEALEWIVEVPERKNLIRRFVFKAFLDRDIRARATSWLRDWERDSPEDPWGVLTSWGALFLKKGEETEAANTYERFLASLQENPNLVCYQLDEEFVRHFGGSYQSFQLLDRTLAGLAGASFAAGIGGTLQLTGIIEKDGTLSGARVEGQGLGYGLDEAALNDIVKWRFSPARINDVPVRLFATIEVNTP